VGLSFNLWIVFLVLALAGIAYYAYRATTPSLSRPFRIGLASLRFVAFGLIAFLLLDPRFARQSHRNEPPRIIALIDQSASMTLPAGGVHAGASRFDVAKELSSRLKDIVEADDGEYAEAFFSGDVITGSRDTLSADGQGTDIRRSLASVEERHEGENVAAFVLLSDGAETTDPLVRRRVPPVPVFAVGFGDTSAPEDIRIKDIDYNTIVRAPSRSTIQTTLGYSGENAKRVQVRLIEDGKTIFKKDTLFTADVQEIEIGIPVDFPEAGRRDFVLEAESDGYDAEAANNRRDIVVEVEKAGVRILIVDLLPEWESHFLTEFLRRDQTFDFDLVSDFASRVSVRGGRLGSPAGFTDRLDEYDALVLSSITSEFLTPSVAGAIKTWVQTDGKGLLIMPGQSSLFENAAAWGLLADVLPVRGMPPHRFNLRFTSVRPGAQATTNAITSQLVPLLAQTDWQQRSPLLGYYTPLAPKDGAEVLLETEGQRVPAFAYQVVGKGRVALLSAGPLWRWKFLSDGNSMYDQMVSKLLDVLSRGEDTERFVISSKKNVYDSGEALTVTAELFDEKMQPVTGAPVRVEIARLEKGGGETPLDIVSMQREGSDNPRFRVDLPPLAAGDYRLRGAADLPGRTVSSETVDITVSNVSVEFQRVAQDRDNLMGIAAQTGGAYANIEGAEALVRHIRQETRSVESTAEISLRTSPWVFAVVLLLLSAEWLIRKRIGMV
jgi:hypothetical protein